MTVDGTIHPHDDLAVYALDALDPDERALVDDHLAGCAACRRELDGHLATLARLTVAEEPPAAMWDRIADLVTLDAGPALPRTAVEAPTPEPPAPAPDRVVPLHARPRPNRAPWLLAAAAAVVAVVGIAVATVAGGGGGGDTVSDLAAAAVDDPGSTVVQLATQSGQPVARVVRTEDGDGFVLLDDLPTLPEGRTYQLWEMADGTPVSLGVLGDGSVDARAVALPGEAGSFAISDEPGGGVPAPTGPVVALSS